MATTYRTPGVYIEEIPKFPSSIAEVETAIPAFIGYTQKAVKGGIDYFELLKKAAVAAENAQKVQEKASKAQADADAAKAEADKAKTDADANPGDQAKQTAAQEAKTKADKAKADADTAKAEADKAKADADAAKFKPVPIRITSLLEYEKFFDTTQNEKGITVTVTRDDVTAQIAKLPEHNMYYSLQAYFANGGGPCYIVPVGGLDKPIKREDLKLGLDAIAKEDEVTLIVFPESLSLITLTNIQKWEYTDYQTLYNDALKQCNDLQDRFVVMDALLDPSTLNKAIKDFTVIDAAKNFRDNGIGTENSKYGAAYGPQLETIFNYKYDPKEVNVTIYINSKGELALPNDSDVKKLEKKHDLVLTTDSDAGGSDSLLTLDDLGPNNEPQNYGQLFPFIQSAIDRLPVTLPAAPIIVGVYASVDNDRGVWKAPANVSLNAVIRPTIKITKEDQDNLNVDTSGKSINAIRAFTGKGTLVWGARTLAGNNNEWRYVSVRRFFIMAEESIKKATEQFVFEPNDANTWINVRAMIENFLTLQWRAGALQGAKPEQAFYVKVGLNATMTALDILEGRLIIEIGLAVVRPAEFIILKFSHKMVES